MDRLRDLAKKYGALLGALVSLLTIAGLTTAFLGGAFDVKAQVQRNRDDIAENRALITGQKARFDIHVSAQRAYEDSLLSFRRELQLTRRTNQQLYDAVKDLQTMLIQKGVDQ